MKTTRKTVLENKEKGLLFENFFQRQARIQGFLCLKNELSARYIGKGRLIAIKSDLDFRLIRQGKVGYFDCKSFSTEKFTYSDLNKDQIDRALRYNEHDVPAGFIVYFLDLKLVRYFSGAYIDKKGPRTSFSHMEGQNLGSIFNLNLRHLLAQ